MTKNQPSAPPQAQHNEAAKHDTTTLTTTGDVDEGSTNEIDVIYHNMYLGASKYFRTIRTTSHGTPESCIQRLARFCSAGCFDRVVNIAASRHSFVVVVETRLTKEELLRRGFPYGQPQDEGVLDNPADSSDDDDEDERRDAFSSDDIWEEIDKTEMDIIYQNMNFAPGSIRTVRMPRLFGVAEQTRRLAHQIADGCFDKVISVSASKASYVVVMETSVSKEKLDRKGFPFTA